MATDLASLIEPLDHMTGAEVGSVDQMALLRSGVFMFNGHAPQPFEISNGTVLDRDATAEEQYLLVLCATYVYLTQESTKYSRQAVKHSNVAGRTDMTGIEFAVSKRKKELLEQELNPLLERLGGRAVVGETFAAEIGESLDAAQAIWPTSPNWP